jgi:pimeloyl-ACP methyl ester carboxylesterase
VGNSVGGSCALEVAREAPDRVRLVVLIGTKVGHRRDPALRDDVLSALESEGMDAAWSRYWRPLFAPDADPAVVERARSVARAQPLDAVANGVRVFHGRPDRSAFARSLDVPVVAIRGDHDIAFRGPARAPEFERAELHVVEACGHYVPLERPAALTAAVDAAMNQLTDYP